MATMTLAIPDDFRKKMAQYPDVNWSALAREAFESKMVDLDILSEIKTLTSKSKLTEKDALELGHKVNAAVARRHEWAISEREKRRTDKP